SEGDGRATRSISRARGEVERRRTAGVIAQQLVELGLKRRVVARHFVGFVQLFERSHQSLMHEAPAISAPVPTLVGLIERFLCHAARILTAAPRTHWTAAQ